LPVDEIRPVGSVVAEPPLPPVLLGALLVLLRVRAVTGAHAGVSHQLLSRVAGQDGGSLICHHVSPPSDPRFPVRHALGAMTIRSMVDATHMVACSNGRPTTAGSRRVTR